jgi:SAM-dependent methyltransferase
MSEASPNVVADPTEVPERFDPGTMHGEVIESEHLARYHWAAQFVSGRRVLDAGCGVGYGSALLARAGASEVVGVDVAGDIVSAAAEEMPAGVTLEVGDVTDLDHEEGRFDLVVCFEVIEHLQNPARAVEEFRRVLAPGGLLVISSPNRDVYPPGNPHHVHEYLPGELEEELARCFPAVRLWRQHTWITSGVLDDQRFAAGDDAELNDVELRKLARDQPGAELYTVALAALGELPEAQGVMELSAPVELRKWDALWHEQQAVARETAADLAQRVHEVWLLRNRLTSAEQELARVPDLQAQVEELIQLNEELLHQNADVKALEETAARYTVVVESTSWKLTRPLRQVVSLIRRFSG